jgi:tetraacyldisaccharide 4'-kinase
VLNFIRIISSPLLFVYSLITQVRNWFFDKGIFKTCKVDANVISVGNITVGGSGKTPLVMMIAEIMKSQQKKIGLLSRGYGRSSVGYVFVSNGKKLQATVDACGDEMYFMADELEVPAAVAERRVEGAQRLIGKTGINTLLLDDAFQHRWIHRNLDIVIFDQRFLNKVGQIEQNMLPLGLMREPFSSLKRADIIIINRKFNEKNEIPSKLKKYFEGKKVFTSYYEEKGIYDVKLHTPFDMKEFQGQKSLVVCGIAKPQSFLKALEKNNIDIKNKMLFPDHKTYSSKEVQDIRKKFYDTNSYSVLTTQKDAVKLTNFAKELDDIDIYYLKIELKLDEQEEFNKLIIKSVK